MKLLRRNVRHLLVLLFVLTAFPAAATSFNMTAVQGTFGFVGWFLNTAAQPAAPQVGAALPAANGYATFDGTLTFDGAGNFTRTQSFMVDGVPANNADGGTYTCNVDGTCALVVAGAGTTLLVQFSAVADTFLFTSTRAGLSPRFAIGTKLSANPVAAAVLNGMAGYSLYGFALGTSPGTAPSPGAALPNPLGFFSQRGTFNFDGTGAATASSQVNSDGVERTDTSAFTFSLTNATNANGAVTYATAAGPFQQGWIGANGMVVSASVFAGLNPYMVVSVPHTGTGYSQASFVGRYSLILRTHSPVAQGTMPAPGATLPTPVGFQVNVLNLQADGAGSGAISGAINLDGTISTTLLTNFTYTVSASGEIHLQTTGGGVFDGYLSTDKQLVTLDSVGAAAGQPQTNSTGPAILFGFKAPSVAPGLIDLNADGKSDLLWRNTNGAAAAWLMNGTTATATATFGPYAGWTLFSGDGDFNSDGKTDLVWTNTNGAISLWLMNGLTPMTVQNYGPYAGWSLLSANSDFNADGKSDLIWVNANGQVAIWLMDGATVLSQATYGPYAGWTVVNGTSDFDGNGTTDLLWRNANGAAAIWLMNGTAVINSATYGPYAGWNVVTGDADYNGDGNADLLWQNANGQIALWLMNGITNLGSATFGPFAGWSVVPGNHHFLHPSVPGVTTDLLWTNTNGAISLWAMNGLSLFVQSPIYGPFAGWSITGATGSCTGTGLTDLLWTNVDGTASLWQATGGLKTNFGPYSGWSVFTGKPPALPLGPV